MFHEYEYQCRSLKFNLYDLSMAGQSLSITGPGGDTERSSCLAGFDNNTSPEDD